MFHSYLFVTCTKGPGHPSYKDGLAGIQRLGAVHDKVTVAQVPGTDLDLRKQQGKMSSSRRRCFPFTFLLAVLVAWLNRGQCCSHHYFGRDLKEL